jgi:hypothetical protein
MGFTGFSSPCNIIKKQGVSASPINKQGVSASPIIKHGLIAGPNVIYSEAYSSTIDIPIH